MQFEEVENCTFEPNCGTMDTLKKKFGLEKSSAPTVPGDYFNKLGTNFATSNPKIFKMGIVKKAMLHWKNDKHEESINTLYDGFNVERIFANYLAHDYKAWKNRVEIQEGRFAKGIPKLKEEMERRFKVLKEKNPFILSFIEEIHEKSEDTIKHNQNKKAVYAENFDNPALKAMYDEAWELLQLHIKKRGEQWKDSKRKKEQAKTIRKVYKTLNDQIEEGFDEGDEVDEVDYRKIYKTIMCPLKNRCAKVKFQRWPSSNLKSHTKFGKDCPYAHHPMELQFPETLQMRMKAAKTKSTIQSAPFSCTGPLYDCPGGCSRCNLCNYKQRATAVIKKQKESTNTKIDMEKIIERKKENDQSVNMFCKKFGMLKKASVLLFYGRANDAFDEIAKAANIIKDQREAEKENESNL